MDEVLLNKAVTIERCLRRIKEEYVGSEAEFKSNYTKQDSVVLNLQRACEAAIDMGNRVLKLHKLGVPQSSRDVFQLLQGAGVISPELSQQMQRMVGLRNIAVHDYQALNIDIVIAVVEKHLQDFQTYIAALNQ